MDIICILENIKEASLALKNPCNLACCFSLQSITVLRILRQSPSLLLIMFLRMEMGWGANGFVPYIISLRPF